MAANHKHHLVGKKKKLALDRALSEQATTSQSTKSWHQLVNLIYASAHEPKGQDNLWLMDCLEHRLFHILAFPTDELNADMQVRSV
jgi:hypothetical protein